jgi:hypothetical protein
MKPSIGRRLAFVFVQWKVTHVAAIHDKHKELIDVFGVISNPLERYAYKQIFERDRDGSGRRVHLHG